MTIETPGIKRLRKIQFGRETAPGTAVAPTALFRGLGTLKTDLPVTFADEDVGYISGVDRTYIPYVGASLALDPVPATFEQFPLLGEMGIKQVQTGAADGAGSGKIYAYPLPTTSRHTIRTSSLEGGDDHQMEKVAHVFAEEFKLTGEGKGAWMMSGTLRGQQRTVNTYTASTIAFVEGTKKITDSANGLAGFTTGMTIKISGTTNNNGTYTVATGGVAAEIVVSETLVTESAGSAFTVEQTFTAVALATVEEMLFQKSKLYMDAVGGTLGGTQISKSFLSAEISIRTGWAAMWTGDGELYFSYIKMTEPEMLVSITYEHNGHATAEKAYWEAQTPRKGRILIEGSALTTAGTTYSKKTVRIDWAGKWEDFDKIGEQDGNDIITGSFRARYNATAGLFGNFTVVNALTSLT